MDISLIFKIAALGVLIAVASKVLESAGRDDIASVITLAGLMIALIMVLSLISDLFSGLKRIFSL